MQYQKTPVGGRIRCALYMRISRDRRLTNLGVQRQEEACRALAQQLGWDVYAVLSENDVSAASGKPRPLYRQLLDLMRSGEVQGVISLHTDRLHRSPTELEEFITICDENNIDVRTVQAGPIDLTSATGRMGARIYGAVARHEVEHGIERQKAAKLQAAQAGKPSGGNRPYGYEQNGMVIIEDEASVVREAIDRFISGDSWRSISADLNKRNIPTAKGNRWSPINVRNVAVRPRNISIRTHNGNEYPAQWPALISMETWEDLQIAIKKGIALYGSRGYSRVHLLTGFVFCGNCGNRMNIINAQNRDGSYVPAFSCRKHDDARGEVGCGKVKRRKAPVEELVIESLMYRLDTPVLTELVEGSKSATPELKALMRERDQQAHRLQEILNLYSTGDMDFNEYKVAKTTAQARLDELGRELDRKTSKATIANIPAGQSVQEAWDKADLPWRIQLVDALIDKVLIHPKQMGDQKYRYKDYIFNPERVEIIWKA